MAARPLGSGAGRDAESALLENVEAWRGGGGVRATGAGRTPEDDLIRGEHAENSRRKVVGAGGTGR